MYTLEQLQSKTFKELKVIGYELNTLPAGDKRCRQNWIDALVGVNFPLLQLLEVFPADRPLERKEISGSFADRPLERKEISGSFADRPLERKEISGSLADRPLERKEISGSLADRLLDSTGIRLSDRFLARYTPPCGESICFNADDEGQLNLFDFEILAANEPPDPDDFEDIDVFYQAIARWDSENQPLEISLDSFCEWAPVPDDWYEPELSEVLELFPGDSLECFITYNFSIPTFDHWCDRSNQPGDSDEPPDTGIYARRPLPKPPSFPSLSVVLGDRANSIKPFACAATVFSARDPPGGDVMQ